MVAGFPRKIAIRIRQLLGQPDAASIRQGIELARSLDNRGLWVSLAAGLSVSDDGVVQIPDDCDVGTLVAADFRKEVALWVMRGAGLLDAIRHLRITGDVKLDALGGLAALGSVHLSECHSTTSLDGLPGLPALSQLRLSFCRELTDLNALRGLTALRSLELNFCRVLTDLDALEELPALESLGIRGCPTVRGMEAIGQLTAAQTVMLEGSDALFDDLRYRGPLYQLLSEQQLLRWAFDPSLIRPVIPDGPPIFLVCLDRSLAAIELRLAFPPLEAYAQTHDHYFDFLCIDAARRNVFGVGLGRKNNVFEYVSENGAAFTGVTVSADCELYTVLKSALEEASNQFFDVWDLSFEELIALDDAESFESQEPSGTVLTTLFPRLCLDELNTNDW